jgi:hypothetical protein
LYRRLGEGNHGSGKVETGIIFEPSWSTTPFALGVEDISYFPTFESDPQGHFLVGTDQMYDIST